MSHYFDYVATTPLDSEVEKEMRPYWSKIFGNPGSLHQFGQKASAAVFNSRYKIANILSCNYKEIIFTGSATEANNLALRGAIKAAKSSIKRPKIITFVIEHESVLATCRDLEQDGVEVVYLPVSKDGIIDVNKFKESLDERTVLVSIMYANNEIGTIQPIKEISRLILEFRKQKVENRKNQNSKFYFLDSNFPLFHTDAVQAFNYLDCDVEKLGVDLMTLSGHKIYGPKGIGLLYARGIGNAARDKLKLNFISPIITGGGQENGFRAGTENLPAIVGFGKAMETADKVRDKEQKRLFVLQKYFLSRIKKLPLRIFLNGDFKNRLPNNLNFYFPSKSAQDLVTMLDLKGFAVSPGSACSARLYKPSHVLKALGHNNRRIMNSLRISLGRDTIKNDIDDFIKVIKML